MGRSSQRSCSIHPLVGSPGRAAVAGAEHRCGHRRPGIERRDRGVRAEEQIRAGVGKASQRVGQRRLLRPDRVGQVTVIDRVLGLHTRPDAETAESRDVRVRNQLRMLDRAHRAGGRIRVEGVGVGDVADRMDRARQPPAGRGGHELEQCLGSNREHPVIARVTRVGVRARGCPGAERAVRDDLERSDPRERRCGTARGVAGAQALDDRPLEELRINAELDLQRVEAAVQPTLPRALVPRHVEIDESDDAAGCRIPRHLSDQLVTQHGVDVIEASGDLERRTLAQDADPVGLVTLTAQRGRVQPHAVDIGTDQVGRHVAGGGIEHGEARWVAPQRIAESGAHAAAVGQHWSRSHEARSVGGRLGAPQRLALGDERPLQDMHVVVPETRDEPCAVGIEHFTAGAEDACRGDVGDDSSEEEDVDRPLGRKQLTPCAADPGVCDRADAVPDHGRTIAS